MEWLIVGGGIHGVHLAARLIGQAGVDPEGVRILDPAETLLARWRACTQVTGMTHLRSPGVHHLDLEPFSLTRFAGTPRPRRRGLLRAPYDRPALSLFDDHCQKVIERFDLGRLHLRDRAIRCDPREDGVRVVTAEGLELDTERVMLALGAADQPAWPSWAPRDEPRVQHVFDRGFAWPTDTACGSDGDSACGPTLVVGGGVTAAQVALRRIAEGHSVHLVTRHPARVHHFDSDPGWVGPRRMSGFLRVRDPDERRQIIQQARYRGSVPPEVHRAIRRSVANGLLEVHEASIDDLRHTDDGVRLELADGRQLDGGHLLLATGFEGHRPGGELVDRLVEEHRLPCAACGYPVVDSGLRWHPRVHVSGPLAELELGPVARNIAGARRAAERLVQLVV